MQDDCCELIRRFNDTLFVFDRNGKHRGEGRVALWFIASISISLGEPVFWDHADENWFHQIEKLDEQIIFGGRVSQGGENFVWVHSWDQEWSSVAPNPSDMQSMASNGSQVAVCGFILEENGPRAWLWALDEEGDAVQSSILVEQGISNCTSIIPYQSGWLASVVLREPERKRSVLIQITETGELTQLIPPIEDIEIMGIRSRLVNNQPEIALAGFSLYPEQTLGWMAVLDQDGQLRWSQELGEGQFNKFKTLRLDYEGNLLSCGYTTPESANNWDIWLLRWDWEGGILFDTIWGGELMDGCKGLRPSSDGFVFIGDSESYGATDWDILRGELSTTGEMLNWEIYGGIGDDYGYDFFRDDNRLFWVGALERDEDGKRVAWAEVVSLATDQAEDSGVEEDGSRTCSCRGAEAGFLMLPLFGVFLRRRRDS